MLLFFFVFFFFNDTATTVIYTLSLHDALPISAGTLSSNTICSPGRLSGLDLPASHQKKIPISTAARMMLVQDRKSTRLNSSHVEISYAVFCLKKKKTKT